MKVNIKSWLHLGRGKERWNEYAVGVAEIPTFDEDDMDSFSVRGWGRSKIEAEILAEVIQHYIDTFPGAEARLRLAANSQSDDDVPLVKEKD